MNQTLRVTLLEFEIKPNTQGLITPGKPHKLTYRTKGSNASVGVELTDQDLYTLHRELSDYIHKLECKKNIKMAVDITLAAQKDIIQAVFKHPSCKTNNNIMNLSITEVSKNAQKTIEKLMTEHHEDPVEFVYISFYSLYRPSTTMTEMVNNFQQVQ